jgi:Protein of unknown function (DUF3592)
MNLFFGSDHFEVHVKNDFDEKLDTAVESYEKKVDALANHFQKAVVGLNRLRTGCLILLANLFFAAFCLWGAYAAVVSWKLQFAGQLTNGAVTRLKESKTESGACCVYSPVIEFDANGRRYSFENDSARSSKDYEIGSIVQVRYDPVDPTTAQIDDVVDRWLFPVLIIPSMIFASLLVNFFLIRAFRRGVDVDNDS